MLEELISLSCKLEILAANLRFHNPGYLHLVYSTAGYSTLVRPQVNTHAEPFATLSEPIQRTLNESSITHEEMLIILEADYAPPDNINSNLGSS